jgi:DNA-binding transcriptional regulator LsrR (DeoR family)
MPHEPSAGDLETTVRELLDAQAAYELVRAAVGHPLADATARREEAMRKASELGLSRRKIAEMTGVSHTRVIQILEAEARRVETMRELRSLEGQQLADRLLGLAYSNSLSREEMAVATGLSVEAVNSMIREYAEQRAHARNIAALEMVRRHMPPGAI